MLEELALLLNSIYFLREKQVRAVRAIIKTMEFFQSSKYLSQFFHPQSDCQTRWGGHSMWNEFFENPFNIQNLCVGIFLVTPLVVSYFRQFFFDSLREKDKRLKDYLIIILGVLMVGLFLSSCGVLGPTFIDDLKRFHNDYPTIHWFHPRKIFPFHQLSIHICQ